MGVPAFFAWLSQRYPKILRDCVEEIAWASDGTELPPDATQPNPNKIEFDSLYLDMNGIIHPCTHPEDRPPPTTEAEMFAEIFRYIDRLVNLVRPRKLLYLAIDGVAPRAKINQQRSRRFRAAQEAAEKQQEEDELRKEWEQRGLAVPDKGSGAEKKPFDSNVITPGTPFMQRLSRALREYAASRIRDNGAWRDLRIIFSDASVPGEGEHKVAEFIRQQRVQPGYNSSTHHVMYGLDADLIMLALATHELNFTILREQVVRGPALAKKNAAIAAQEQQKPKPGPGGVLMGTVAELGGKKPFQFLHISVLREYLEFEFRSAIEGGFQARKIDRLRRGLPSEMEEEFDLERVIDDFIFLCFFVGNDFLPHLPTLDIREGALDFLIELYKKMMPVVGYLTDGTGNLFVEKVRLVLVELGELEDEVFAKRMEKDERNKQRDRALQQRLSGGDSAPQRASEEETRQVKEVVARQVQLPEPVDMGAKRQATDAANRQAADSIRKRLAAKRAIRQDPDGSGDHAESEVEALKRRKTDQSPAVDQAAENPQTSSTPDRVPEQEESVCEEERGKDDSSATVENKNHLATDENLRDFDSEIKARLRKKSVVENQTDHVRLGQAGWKERYYKEKFHWTPNSPATKREKARLFHSYYEGLLWVLRYYYRGVSSWEWYYPFHYAPFASDLGQYDVRSDSLELTLGAPFRPFEQLMGVLPAISAKGVLPDSFVELMEDPSSPILEYYPVDFQIDLNGKRFAWQGVALLPFVDAERLKTAIAEKEGTLTEDEKTRNQFGVNQLIVCDSSVLGSTIQNLDPAVNFSRISPEGASGILFGGVSKCADQLGNASGVQVAVLAMPPKRKHLPKPVAGSIMPPATLNEHDKYETVRGNQGWSAARFGVLGRAANKMAMERKNMQVQISHSHPHAGGGLPLRNDAQGPGGFRVGGGSFVQAQRPAGGPPVHQANRGPFQQQRRPQQGAARNNFDASRGPPSYSHNQLRAAQEAIAFAQAATQPSGQSYQHARAVGNYPQQGVPSGPASGSQQHPQHVRFDAYGNPIVYNSNYDPFNTNR